MQKWHNLFSFQPLHSQNITDAAKTDSEQIPLEKSQPIASSPTPKLPEIARPTQPSASANNIQENLKKAISYSTFLSAPPPANNEDLAFLDDIEFWTDRSERKRKCTKNVVFVLGISLCNQMYIFVVSVFSIFAIKKQIYIIWNNIIIINIVWLLVFFEMCVFLFCFT